MNVYIHFEATERKGRILNSKFLTLFLPVHIKIFELYNMKGQTYAHMRKGNMLTMVQNDCADLS
jgi:hypothetical protein